MKPSWWKIGVVVVLVVAIAAVIAQKQQKQSAASRAPLTASASAPTGEQSTSQGDVTTTAQPPRSADLPKKTVAGDAPVKSGEVCPTPPPSLQATMPAKTTNRPTTATKTAPAVPPTTTTVPLAKPAPKTVSTMTPAPKALPRLVDVGSTQCIPCKMMAPILEELKITYHGQLVVEFIDINEDRDAAARYGVNTIPTQIFYDEHGKEFTRHIGFFPKDDILATFAKQGITLSK